jgi:hypothetical protein
MKREKITPLPQQGPRQPHPGYGFWPKTAVMNAPH